jgi:hypothetical protein
VDPEIFELTRKKRWRCKICGHSDWPGRWTILCSTGHPFVCACGRKYPTAQARGTHARFNGCYRTEGEQ